MSKIEKAKRDIIQRLTDSNIIMDRELIQDQSFCYKMEFLL